MAKYQQITKEQVVKFIGKKRLAKLEELDVYMVCGVIPCIDAMSYEEWVDDDNSHTFVFEGHTQDETPKEMMVSFRYWLDTLSNQT